VTSVPARSIEAPGLPLVVRALGTTEYQQTWDAMRRFTEDRTPDTTDELWLVEHFPVYTLGTNDRHEPFDNPDRIPVVHCDRGGQITYHGPGQLVLYTLLDLRRRGLGVKSLVHALEQSVIDLLAQHRIQAMRRPGAPGVYVEDRKIAQLGLRVRQRGSYHGLSLNVDMDHRPFQRIQPCGYAGLETTDLAQLLGPQRPSFSDTADALVVGLSRILGYNLRDTGQRRRDKP